MEMEPWKLTKDEFENKFDEPSELELIRRYVHETGRKVDDLEQVREYFPEQWKELQDKKRKAQKFQDDIYNYVSKHPKAPKGLARIRPYHITRSVHKNLVGQALMDGKQVPDRVLKDYPDLIELLKTIPHHLSDR